jgi:preprotein translocase subunit SecF
MLIGFLAGTYSTVFIAAPLVLWLQQWTGTAAASTTPRGMQTAS